MKKFSLALLTAAILSAAILAGCNQPIDNPEYTSTANGVQIITENTAKRAAAERANLTIDDVQYTKAVLDTDDGRNEYDIEFVHDGYEYEIEVNAEDGSIKSYDKEKIDSEATPTVNSNASESVNASAEASSITSEEVKNITEAAALKAALAKAELAGVAKDDLVRLKIEFEIDDGVPEYEVDFEYDGFEYDITVNANNGEIIKFEKEAERINTSNSPNESSDATTNNSNVDINNDPIISEQTLIGEDAALAKALEHASLADDDITLIHIELNRDDGRYEYEVEFYCNYDEYDYDINAIDGSVISVDKETEHGKAPEKTTQTEGNVISSDDAKAVALAHAGVDAANIYNYEIELDKDDGIIKYEIEFKSAGYEYKYDINAMDGSILKNEKDFDD